MRQVVISDGLWLNLKSQSKETGIAIGELIAMHRRPARVVDVISEHLKVIDALLFALPGGERTHDQLDEFRKRLIQTIKESTTGGE